MRLEKSEQLLKLALMMQSSTEGVGLQEIQEEFEVGRRTAERMRDALLQLFPHVEEMRLDGKTKRWRLPASAIAGLIQISAEDLAEMRTAIDLLKKENLNHHAENRLTQLLRLEKFCEAPSRITPSRRDQEDDGFTPILRGF